MARPSVVLPEPDPPTTATTSPGWMASDTPRTASLGSDLDSQPWRVPGKLTCTSFASISGACAGRAGRGALRRGKASIRLFV